MGTAIDFQPLTEMKGVWYIWAKGEHDPEDFRKQAAEHVRQTEGWTNLAKTWWTRPVRHMTWRARFRGGEPRYTETELLLRGAFRVTAMKL